MGNFKTVYEDSHGEIVIEKSRFIAYCRPIQTEEEATLFIEQIKKKHWDAAHNVPVYVLGEKYHTQRYSDDGEPSGTAGVPILSMLKNEGITDVVVVVTRYFGGVKLGTGGLVRAYTQAAKIGLDASKIIEKLTYAQVSIHMAYTLHGKVQNYLMNQSEIIIEDTLFSDEVQMVVFTKPEAYEQLENKMIDLTSGQAQNKRLEDFYLSVYEGEILEKNPV